MMGSYRKQCIELSPQLMKKLFEFVKAQTVTPADFDWIVNNLAWMSKGDVLLTVEEFEQITKKPTVV